MKAVLLLAMLLSGAGAQAQAPAAPAPATPAPSTPGAPPPPSGMPEAGQAKPHASDLGFTYSVPGDWDVVDPEATLPAAKEQAGQAATSEEEKKGLACVQLALTARHGQPPSVVVEVALPFACFGQEMTAKDLPGFATGASEGLKQSFDVSEPVFGAYALGSHNMWIERAKGSPKGHPEIAYTVEITCSLLKKAAVCWMAMAADDAALATFEGGAVTLDGETAQALVPSTAFDKKPS